MSYPTDAEPPRRGVVLCIYHANCADGLGAAWAAHKTLGDDVEFVAASYSEHHELLTPDECVASGHCPSQEDIPRPCYICDGGLGYCKKCHRAEIQLDQPCGIPLVEGRDILIVDFSYSLPALRAIAAEARSVLVLDHHKTAQEDLAGVGYPNGNCAEFRVAAAEARGTSGNFTAIFDLSRSGAGITWDYLNPGTPRSFGPSYARLPGEDVNKSQPDPIRYGPTPRPRIIDLIEDRDLWRFAYGDESRAFQAVLTSYDLSDLPAMFERMDQWHEWSWWKTNPSAHVGGAEAESGLWDNLILQGCAIMRANGRLVAGAVRTSRRTMLFAGYMVPVACVPGALAFEAGHLLCHTQAVENSILTEMGLGAMRYDENSIGRIETAVEAAAEHLPPFSATYYDGADGLRHFSLRSPPGGADVGAVAKELAARFGTAGGGHEHAAGFDAPLGWDGE